jgi:hypothetical protein
MWILSKYCLSIKEDFFKYSFKGIHFLRIQDSFIKSSNSTFSFVIIPAKEERTFLLKWWVVSWRMALLWNRKAALFAWLQSKYPQKVKKVCGLIKLVDPSVWALPELQPELGCVQIATLYYCVLVYPHTVLPLSKFLFKYWILKHETTYHSITFTAFAVSLSLLLTQLSLGKIDFQQNIYNNLWDIRRTE